MPRTDFTPIERPETPVKARRSNNPALLSLALKAVDLAERKRRAKEALAALELVEIETWREMITLGLGFGETIVGGKVRLKRSWRAGPITVSFAKAKDAGAITSPMLRALEPFTTIADPYEEWDPKLLPAAIPEPVSAASAP